MHKQRMLGFVLAVSMGTSSCWLRKQQARAFVPPPTRPRPALPARPVVPTPPFEIALNLQLPDVPPETLPAVMPPVQPRRAAVPATPKAPTPVSPPNVAETPATAPPPRIEEFLSPDQRLNYTKELDFAVERTRRIMGSVAGKHLSAEQTEIADRVQTFLKQAEQARDQDLVTAVNLARRADLLAQDLLKRLP